MLPAHLESSADSERTDLKVHQATTDFPAIRAFRDSPASLVPSECPVLVGLPAVTVLAAARERTASPDLADLPEQPEPWRRLAHQEIPVVKEGLVHRDRAENLARQVRPDTPADPEREERPAPMPRTARARVEPLLEQIQDLQLNIRTNKEIYMLQMYHHLHSCYLT